MGLFDRISRVIRANLNSLVGRAEDPEKILEQAVQDMQDDLIQLRQAVAQAIATQKRSERQQSQAESMANEWQRRAQLALEKGDESLAREALVRRKSYKENADAIRAQLDQQNGVVVRLKQSMGTLESKLAEAKTRKDLFVARARAAKASQQLNEMLGRTSTSSALSAFERMEDRVNQLEAESEAAAELAEGDDVEKQFAALESGGDIDQELVALKAELQAGKDPEKLPPSQASE